jgi:hypothetical protein
LSLLKMQLFFCAPFFLKLEIDKDIKKKF